jgi:4-amino-4-deoxy-L-arabinose transferase-like glycosyltransferase
LDDYDLSFLMLSDSSKIHVPGSNAMTKARSIPLFRPSLLIGSRTYVLAVILIVLVTFLARASALFSVSIDADEGVYLVMAQQWQHGGLPYVAVWDQHPPGLPALLAAVLDIVFDPVLGARLAALTAVTATAVLIYRSCQRHADNAAAGLTAALLYVVCISGWAGLSANTEIFNNLCVTFAAYHLVAAARHPPDRSRAMMAAFVLGVGLQFKYVVFPEAILFSFGYLLASYRRNRDLGGTIISAGLMLLAGLLPTVLAVGYFWSNGALRAFLEANIGANVTYVGLVPPLREILHDSAGGMLPIVGPVLIMAYAILRRVPWRPRWSNESSFHAWILLWIVAAALDVCLPMKFFRHYFFALYPPVCLGAALALDALAAGQRRPFVYGLIALLATAAPTWVKGFVRLAPWAGQDVPRTIAEIVQQAGAQDGDLYVYRYQPSVYALARLRPPTPYVMTLELSEFSQSAHVDGIKEIQRIMAGQPRFIVKPEGTLGGRAGAVDQVLTRSLAQYRLVRTFQDGPDRSVIDLYER